MHTDIENGPVAPHAQAFADEGNRQFGTIFKTYNGHQPSRDLALDCWDSLEDRRRLAEFAVNNWLIYGVDYVIHEQRIWNPEISLYWRPMEDRKSDTANHMDHVHISFIPNPLISQPEEDTMKYAGWYIYKGQTWVTDGLLFRRYIIGPADRSATLIRQGVPQITDILDDELDDFHNGLIDLTILQSNL